MSEIILTTFDWVPEVPRGYVRDLRIRWALEEASLPYRVDSTPFRDRSAAHFANQPFGQAPWITDDGITIFESGAILLHLGAKSEALLPRDPRARSKATEWLFAALNSVEMFSLPWSLYKFTDDTSQTPGRALLENVLQSRLQSMDRILAKDEWLAGSFSVADIVMADVLRLVDRFDGLAEYPACRDFITRAVSRPGFSKAHADQMAYFAAADQV